MADIQPIGLQVQTPTPTSPLQTIGGLMNLRQQMSEVALRHAQIQEAHAREQNIQAEADQRNRDLSDQNTLQEALKDPAQAKALGSGDFSALNGRIQPKTLEAFRTAHLNNVEKQAAIDESTLKLNATRHSQIEQGLAGLAALEDDTKIQEAYPGLILRLQEEGSLKPGTFPQTISSRDELNSLAAKNALFQGMNEKVLATKKTKTEIAAKEQETATSAASAAEAKAKTVNLEAELPKITAEAAIKQAELKGINADWNGTVDKAISDPTLNKTTKALVAASPTLEGKLQAVRQAAGEQATTNREIDPRVINAHVNQAVAVEMAKARLAGGIGQIVDPQQRTEASRTLDAADKEAIDKIAAANSLKNTVQLALSGNKVAPNLETIEELRSIVNRVNGQELKSVGASGNAYDKVRGWLGGWVAGQPIPENIQQDFLAVADGQQKIAEQKHAASYGTVAARFGVKDLHPPDIAGIYSKAAGTPAPAQKIRVKRKSDGQSGTVDASDFDPAKYDKL